jgi:hypothetical protein
MVAAVGVASLAVLGATGGFSYAATSIANAAQSVGTAVHLTSAPKFSSHSTSAGSAYVPAPSISGISPSHGTINTKVTVSGANLTKATVDLGSETLRASVKPTSISFSVPTDAATGATTVSAHTAGGSASTGFTVDPAPAVSTFVPSASPVEPGTTIAITGTNLDDVTSVKFGTIAASFSGNATSMTVVTPSILHSGTSYTVFLFSPASTIGITAGPAVSTAPGPVVKSVVPLTGITGTIVKLTGQNFNAANDDVTIDGVTAFTAGGTPPTAWTVANAYVSVPNLSGVSDVGLVTISDQTGGSSSYSKTFMPIVTPIPTGDGPSVAGEPGKFGGAKGSTFTITGTHLWGVTVVTFQNNNGKPATAKPTVSADGTSLSGKVPSNAASGTVTVTNAAAPGGVATADPFFLESTPSISGVAQTGANLVISGTNFDGTTSVMLGNVSLGFVAGDLTIGTPDTISISIPGTGAPDGTLTVTNGAGKSTTKAKFTGDPVIKSASTKTVAGLTTVKISGTGLLNSDGSPSTVTIGGHTVTLITSGTSASKSTSLTGTATGLTPGAIVTVDVTTDVGTTSKSGVKVANSTH